MCVCVRVCVSVCVHTCVCVCCECVIMCVCVCVCVCMCVWTELTLSVQYTGIYFTLYICSGRAVQASSSYGPWVPHTPLLQSDAACQRLAGAAQCSIKDSFCPVSVPCAEKCWLTPTPRVYMLKSVLLFPYLEDLVLKSASPPLPPPSLHAENVCSSSLSY